MVLNRVRLGRFGLLLLLVGLCACSGAKRRPDVLELAEGRKIALLDVDGEGGASARSVVEVGLINALSEGGQFELVSKQDVQAAKDLPTIDPTNLKSITLASGADFGMVIHVRKFFAEETTGITKERVFDSQLAQERGKDEGETDRLIHVKRLNGDLTLGFELVDAQTGDRTGPDTSPKNIISAHDEVTADTHEGAAHLPPRLRFMERLAQRTIRAFLNHEAVVKSESDQKADLPSDRK